MKCKKIVAALLAGVMTVGMLTGCGSGSETKNDGKTIRILTRMAGSSKQVEIYNEVLDEFKAKHPDVTIVDDSQSDEGAFNNILSTDIASGSMANIFRIQGVANLSEYIDNGLLLDVQPYLDEDPEWGDGFTEGSLKYYQVPGKEGTYAVPMEAGIVGVYYNEDLLKKAGVDKFPETWSELLVAIDKLNAIDVIPIAMGAQSTYMVGHLHNWIFYKYLGTEKAKALGAREISWTDPEVLQTVQYVKDLIDAGAFDESAAGLTDELAMTQFQQGQAAMVITGGWNNSNFENKEDTPVSDSIKLAKFPYFDDKPEFKDEDMTVVSPYMISGKLEGEELELTIELVKMLTSKETAERFAEEAGFYIPRTDMELDESNCGRLFLETVALSETSTGVAADVFDFDPIASMQDRTRNSLVSLFTGATPEDVVKEIQAEVDSNK